MQSPHTRAYFLLIILAGAALLVFSMLRPFLVTLALAVVFAAALFPLYTFFLRLLRDRRGLAATATMLVALVCIIAPIALLGSRVLLESQQLYVSLVEGRDAGTRANVTAYVGEKLDLVVPGSSAYVNEFSGDLSIYVKQGLSWVIQHLSVAFSSVLGLFLRLFIFFMALFYFLVEGRKIRAAIIRLSPLRDEDDSHILSTLARTVNSVVKGALVIAVIQGVLATAGFLLFGVPNPFLWGAVTSIAALIPGVGTSLVLGPAIVYLFAVGNTVSAIGLLVWGIAVVGLVDNFLGPRLMGRGAQLHPLAILLTVLGGISIFGPAGIFLGPIVLSLLLALFSVYAKEGNT